MDRQRMKLVQLEMAIREVRQEVKDWMETTKTGFSDLWSHLRVARHEGSTSQATPKTSNSARPSPRSRASPRSLTPRARAPPACDPVPSGNASDSRQAGTASSDRLELAFFSGRLAAVEAACHDMYTNIQEAVSSTVEVAVESTTAELRSEIERVRRELHLERCRIEQNASDITRIEAAGTELAQRAWETDKYLQDYDQQLSRLEELHTVKKAEATQHVDRLRDILRMAMVRLERLEAATDGRELQAKALRLEFNEATDHLRSELHRAMKELAVACYERSGVAKAELLEHWEQSSNSITDAVRLLMSEHGEQRGSFGEIRQVMNKEVVDLVGRLDRLEKQHTAVTDPCEGQQDHCARFGDVYSTLATVSNRCEQIEARVDALEASNTTSFEATAALATLGDVLARVDELEAARCTALQDSLRFGGRLEALERHQTALDGRTQGNAAEALVGVMKTMSVEVEVLRKTLDATKNDVMALGNHILSISQAVEVVQESNARSEGAKVESKLGQNSETQIRSIEECQIEECAPKPEELGRAAVARGEALHLKAHAMLTQASSTTSIASSNTTGANMPVTCCGHMITAQSRDPRLEGICTDDTGHIRRIFGTLQHQPEVHQKHVHRTWTPVMSSQAHACQAERRTANAFTPRRDFRKCSEAVIAQDCSLAWLQFSPSAASERSPHRSPSEPAQAFTQAGRLAAHSERSTGLSLRRSFSCQVGRPNATGTLGEAMMGRCPSSSLLGPSIAASTEQQTDKALEAAPEERQDHPGSPVHGRARGGSIGSHRPCHDATGHVPLSPGRPQNNPEEQQDHAGSPFRGGSIGSHLPHRNVTGYVQLSPASRVQSRQQQQQQQGAFMASADAPPAAVAAGQRRGGSSVVLVNMVSQTGSVTPPAIRPMLPAPPVASPRSPGSPRVPYMRQKTPQRTPPGTLVPPSAALHPAAVLPQLFSSVPALARAKLLLGNMPNMAALLSPSG